MMSAEKSLDLAVEKAGIKEKKSLELSRRDMDVLILKAGMTVLQRSPVMPKVRIT